MTGDSYHIAFLSPNRGQIGEAYVIPRLARALAERGHRVDLLRAWDEWRDVDLGDSNLVRVVSLGSRRFLPVMPDISRFSSWASYRMRSALMAAAMMPGLVCYLRGERPDFMVARMQTMASIVGRALSRTETKLVLSMAGLPRSSGYRNFLWPRLYPHADAFVAPARSLALAASERARIDSDRFDVIPNPVIDQQLLRLAEEPLDDPWFGDPRHPTVLAVGRLTRQKDFATLVRAMALVRETSPARLVIIGQGEDEYRRLLERLRVELGLEDAVRLHGFDPNPYKYMRAADLFVMSSEWEGPGHVLIEAQAIGTPAVSTDCPAGPRDTLLDGEAGLLVPVGDPPAMAEAILESLTDRGRARRMADIGLHNRERYYPQNVAGQWESLLERISGS